MKHSAAVVVALVFGVTLSMGATYTLDDLLREGFANSKQIKAEEEALKKADAQVAEAYGSAMPSLDLSGNYTYAFLKYNSMATMSLAGSFPPFTNGINQATEPGAYSLASTFDGLFGNLTTAFIDTRASSLSATLSLKQMLYAQGKIGLGLKAAKAYKAGALDEYEATRQGVKASITKSFYGALLAQKNMGNRQEAVKLSQELHRITVLRFKLGKGSELDTFTSCYNYEKALIDLQSAASQQIVAREQLIKQAGIAENAASFSVNGEFPAAGYSISQEEAAEKMRAHNPQIAQLDEGVKLQGISVDAAKSDFYPIVSCGASYGKIYPFASIRDVRWESDAYDDAKVYVNASWNIFSGFSTVQKVKQARADQSSFDQTRKQTLDQLDVRLTSAYQDLVTSKAQLESTRALNLLAERAYSIAKSSYEMGGITLVDLQQRELDLENARMSYNGAQFSYSSAVVDIKILTGEF